MEILTDVLAILGWFLFGLVLPVLFSYLGGSKGALSTVHDMSVSAISFGLIAASLVLG